MFVGWYEAVKSGEAADRKINAARSQNAAKVIRNAIVENETIYGQIETAKESTASYFNSQSEDAETGDVDTRQQAMMDLEHLSFALTEAVETEHASRLRILSQPFG